MSGDIQIGASESWYSYVPPIKSAVPQSLLSIPQAAIAAVPVALSFEQSYKGGESRLYKQNKHVAFKVGVNLAVSVVSSVVRDTLRALQISYVTNGYVWEPNYSSEEYLPFTRGGTDTTLGLGVDGARAFNNGPLALYGEKVWLNRVTIPNLKASLERDALKILSQKPNVEELPTYRKVAEASAKIQEKVAASAKIVLDQKRLELDFVERMKFDLLQIENPSGGHSAPAASKAVSFSSEVAADKGATSILKPPSEHGAEFSHTEGLSEKGLRGMIQRILNLDPTEEVTSGRVDEAIVQLKKQVEEAEVNMHVQKSVGLARAHANSHAARVQDYSDRGVRLTGKQARLENAKTRHSEITSQLTDEQTPPPPSALSTVLKCVEWGFNLLRLGSFLHDQANYNERLNGLKKAYKKQTISP